MELYIFSLLSLTFAVVAIFAAYKSFEARRRFDEMKVQYAISSQEESRLQGIVHSFEHETIKLRDRAVEAETRIHMLQEQFEKMEVEKNEALNAREVAERNYYDAKNAINLANQRLADSELKMQQWEQDKERIFKETQAAMFQTGKEVFSKEAEELNKKTLKESEEISKKTKEHFDTIIQKVTALSSNVENHDKGINLLFKSMSSPAAIGQFSEVGLANILKEYGLVEGQDFIIQYSIGAGEGAKRPDAILFVRDNVFIIDSKASKFFLEFAEAEGTAREQEVLESIKKSMNKHLSDLASKGYREAVVEEIKKTRGNNEIGHVQTVMFLCNEAHVNKIAQADTEFIKKAIAKDMIISGPTGLQGLLALARYSIARQNQEENQERIIHEIGNLLGSISTVVGHAIKVGSGIKSSAQHYEKLVSSINSNLLSKANKINKLGVAVSGNKQLPAKLASFTVMDNSGALIESEAVNEDEETSSGEKGRALELVAG